MQSGRTPLASGLSAHGAEDSSDRREDVPEGGDSRPLPRPAISIERMDG